MKPGRGVAATRHRGARIQPAGVCRGHEFLLSSPPGDAGPRVMKPGHDEAAAGCRGCGSSGGKAAEPTSFSVVVN